MNDLPDFLEKILSSGEINVNGTTTRVTGFSNRNNLVFLKNIIKSVDCKKDA
jgi:hypothetical protein